MEPEMTVDELKTKLDKKEPFILLDVREPHELQIARIAGAPVTHIPMGELPQRLAELDKKVEIAVLCRSGGRSAHVTHHLREMGYNAVNVAGGILAWSARIDPSVRTY